MIAIDPIIRGESKALRVTFLNADTETAIDCTGWTLHVDIGRSRSRLGDLLQVSAVADLVSGAQGQIMATLTAEQTEALAVPSAVVEFSVDTGTGNRIPLMLAVAVIQAADQYRQQYYQTYIPNSALMKDVPTVVQGSVSQPQEIKLSFSTVLDPTFDLGVMVRFDELAPETKTYLDSLAADVAAKHSDIMGAP